MRRGRLAVRLGLALLGGASLPGVVHAQASNLSVTYLSQKATPTAEDFAQGFVVIGKFDVVIQGCQRNNCYVHMSATNQPSTNQLRVRINAAAPTTAAQCATALPAQDPPTTSSLFVGNAASGFPVTFTVWVCYPLSWTGSASAPNSFLPSQFRFRLTQANAAGS